jgi:hypothetical protein
MTRTNRILGGLLLDFDAEVLELLISLIAMQAVSGSFSFAG